MEKNQNSQPLAEALDGFIAGEPAYFCIPGHRFSNGIPDGLKKRFGEGAFKYDLTEANGLDDLHAASGAIKEAQDLAAQLYSADRTWFLVNGTTCGNEALMLAAARENEEVIVARNVHKSVISGLVLSGAKPVWILPETDPGFGFSTTVSPDKLKKTIEQHRGAKAVFIVSPTYYGVNSDIGALAEICHENNIPLIVDEAHGAHLYFNERFPKGALGLGADAVVMSTHKTLNSMTQSSMLHIKGSRIDERRIDAALKMTMSSSPSYVLMTSLDAARAQMAECGHEILQSAFGLSMKLRQELSSISGIEVFGGSDAGSLLFNRIDMSRVVFSGVRLGLSGYELSDIFFDKYSVALEMADGICCVAVVTGANKRSETDRLVNALRDISSEYADKAGKNDKIKYKAGPGVLPKMKLTPREAFFAEYEMIKPEKALGRISAQSVSIYPPGIPAINAGEVIDENVLSVIGYCRENGVKVHTDTGEGIGYIKVVK
ncbi:MAG TPA: aminotransferase class I/II-fold pyridoxal phosphate-dependent enzyme [Candidatus Alectryocaccobium stercorigallinarum]|nr:aminotransferase class I/II-fold pyridoxal phosphate-dependent enzyme [Candidatus Alectryocaccobium stercorigallinarum]